MTKPILFFLLSLFSSQLPFSSGCESHEQCSAPGEYCLNATHELISGERESQLNCRTCNFDCYAFHTVEGISAAVKNGDDDDWSSSIYEPLNEACPPDCCWGDGPMFLRKALGPRSSYQFGFCDPEVVDMEVYLLFGDELDLTAEQFADRGEKCRSYDSTDYHWQNDFEFPSKTYDCYDTLGRMATRNYREELCTDEDEDNGVSVTYTLVVLEKRTDGSLVIFGQPSIDERYRYIDCPFYYTEGWWVDFLVGGALIVLSCFVPAYALYKMGLCGRSTTTYVLTNPPGPSNDDRMPEEAKARRIQVLRALFPGEGLHESTRQASRDCAICLTELNGLDGDCMVVSSTNCNHWYHRDCILHWMEKSVDNNACPECRHEMFSDEEYKRAEARVAQTVSETSEEVESSQEAEYDVGEVVNTASEREDVQTEEEQDFEA